MTPSLELSVYKLIINASLFTKFVFVTLFIISVVSWAIMINKYFFIRSYRKRIAMFLKALTNQGDLVYIEDTCTRFGTGAARTMPVALLKLLKARQQGKLTVSSEAILNNVITHESTRLTSGMPTLATAANISPLLGLLGTVWGVMYSFINIGQMGNASIAVVAPGIAEALTTTIAGLCVAIPAMAGHGYLTGSINACLDSLDRVNDFAQSILRRDPRL